MLSPNSHLDKAVCRMSSYGLHGTAVMASVLAIKGPPVLSPVPFDENYLYKIFLDTVGSTSSDSKGSKKDYTAMDQATATEAQVPEVSTRVSNQREIWIMY